MLDLSKHWDYSHQNDDELDDWNFGFITLSIPEFKPVMSCDVLTCKTKEGVVYYETLFFKDGHAAKVKLDKNQRAAKDCYAHTTLAKAKACAEKKLAEWIKKASIDAILQVQKALDKYNTKEPK